VVDLVPAEYTVYAPSVTTAGNATVALVRGPEGKLLWLSQPLPGFRGQALPAGGVVCPLSSENAQALGCVFPWLFPRRLPDRPSFGFGDRLGLATPGHIRACTRTRVFPILAQQSVRENARTGRTFEEVLASAIFGAFQEGYSGGFGADADHVKTIEDALHAADLGFTLFTCDPSDHIAAMGPLPSTEVARRFRIMPEAPAWRKEYLNREFDLNGWDKIRFTEEGLAYTAVKYGAAVRFASAMDQALRGRCPAGFDFELSVDETATPTGPLEHLFLAHELRRHDVALTGLAPRFPGAMEKGVDWRGDLVGFREGVRVHVAIARTFGPYRLSLHSGSDKFSLYPILAEEAGDLWHVKTAGTSYLVALEVAARHAPALFREITQLSLARFPEDRKTYHLSADPKRIRNLETITDQELPRLLANGDTRQVLHVAYGSVLRSDLGEDLRAILDAHEEVYHGALTQHLGRHLAHLGATDDG